MTKKRIVFMQAGAIEVEAILIAGTNDGRHERQRPSMGQDMLKGRRTEIDFIGWKASRGESINAEERRY